MNLVLRREDATDARTIGRLTDDADGYAAFWTLEDRLRYGPKVPGETAIPAGRYRVVVTLSKRFGRQLPLLLDVPGFEGIRIHTGNTAANTSGCVLVGLGREPNLITRSRDAMNILFPRIEAALARHEHVWITIVDPEKESPDVLRP